jgi:hypothetical protein
MIKYNYKETIKSEQAHNEVGKSESILHLGVGNQKGFLNEYRTHET